MTIINYSITVCDELSTNHKIIAIKKCLDSMLDMTLDNGVHITVCERDILTHDFIPMDNMYVVRVTRE